MDRLQKKSFVASTGLHLLLLGILLLGVAFVASPSKPNNRQVLDSVPPGTVEKALTGRASAQRATAGTSAIASPVLVARPEPSPERTPPKDPVRDISPLKDLEGSPEPSTERTPKKLTFDFTLVTRPARDTQADAKNRAAAEARERQQEYERQLAAWQHGINAAVRDASKGLESGLSGGASFEWPAPGDGSVLYANFFQRVKSVYGHAWIVPDGITDETATVGVSVTIARDGRVVGARITRSSRNAAVDHSVQVTLDRVKYAAPLPEGAKESQRTVSINFNVAARRALE
jgi:TonB family protein